LYSYLNLFFFQTFIFDFDGTLYLSNEIKKEGFFHCASPFPNGKNIMDYALNNLNKKDRYSIFRFFANEISNKELKESNLYKKLLNDYHDFTLNNISKLEPIIGSIELLEKLKRKGKYLFINSATPYSSLNETLVKLGILNYFECIFGMELSKLENLKKIQKEYKLNKDYMIMIGDGIDDKEAANEFKIEFLPVGKNLTKNNPNYLRFI